MPGVTSQDWWNRAEDCCKTDFAVLCHQILPGSHAFLVSADSPDCKSYLACLLTEFCKICSPSLTSQSRLHRSNDSAQSLPSLESHHLKLVNFFSVFFTIRQIFDAPIMHIMHVVCAENCKVWSASRVSGAFTGWLASLCVQWPLLQCLGQSTVGQVVCCVCRQTCMTCHFQ